MKAFRFPLDRALHWRRTQLDLERAAVERLARQRSDLERAEQGTITARNTAETSIAQSATSEWRDFGTLSGFQVRIEKDKETIRGQRAAIDRAIAAQAARAVEAQRRVRLLERLRERRKAAWTAEWDGEQERFAAEAWLGRMNRMSR